MLVLRGFSTLATDFVACLKEFDRVPRDWAIKSSLRSVGASWVHPAGWAVIGRECRDSSAGAG